MACEDAILQEWCSFLTEKRQPQHMSLHLDGARILRVPNVSAQALCEEPTGHIAAKTGFQLQIVDTRHFTVLELLQKEAFAPDDVLRQHGNCIPHATACLEKCPDATMYTEGSEAAAHTGNALSSWPAPCTQHFGVLYLETVAYASGKRQRATLCGCSQSA